MAATKPAAPASLNKDRGEFYNLMQLEIGKIYEGKVTGITKFGAFVELEAGTTGMVHISEVANSFVNEIRDHITEGQVVKVKVLTIGDDKKISLSIKKAMDMPPPQRREYKPREGGQGAGGSVGGGRPPRPQQRRDVWEPKRTPQPSELTFEDMMSRFKQNSEEKQCDLKKIIDNKRKSSSRKSGGK